MKKLIFYFFVLFSTSLFAQVGINTTTPNAQLDIRSSNQAAPTATDGMLIPKMDTFPAINPTIAQQGMLVYLTTTVGSNTPGFYYWDNATLTWINLRGADGGTLDQAYDFGGAGNGKTITADVGAVLINGTDGLVSTGTVGIGAIAPSGAGTKMFWNPRRAAFRAGSIDGANWNDANLGVNSVAFGNNTVASADSSTAFGSNTFATADFSTAFGTNTSAIGLQSTAFGGDTNANGDYATAFGHGNISASNADTSFGSFNVASGGSSTAFGQNNLSVGFASTAFGSSTNAGGTYATTFGFSTVASGESALAFGSNSQSSGINSLAFGSNSMATASGATAFGENTQARLNFATAFGQLTIADGISSTAFGNGSMAINQNAVAFGNATTASGINATAFGSSSNASNNNTLAFGNNNQAMGVNSTSFGRNTTASSENAVSFGESTTSSGTNATSFGFNTLASGDGSLSFGESTTASGFTAVAFGSGTVSSGLYATAFGNNTEASGAISLAFGDNGHASGGTATAFGSNTIADGNMSTAFGSNTIATGNISTAFGQSNIAPTYAETVLGIGATTYTPSSNGETQFRTTNATDRLFVVGNAIDSNGNGFVDPSERSDAMIVSKNGLTRLPSTTNTMIDAADGKAVVTKEYLQSNLSGTLDQAYDFGGAGNGNSITADAGAVTIVGTDGLISTGTLNTGAVGPSGAGVKMFWNPRKAAFRAGEVFTNEWDDSNIGIKSVAMGHATRAFGSFSTAFGNDAEANGGVSTAFGINTNANGGVSTVFGRINTANGDHSFVTGRNNFGNSYGETVFGLGATIYTISTNGATEFRTANASDRLFVIGNAIDSNNNNTVDASERSDAMVVLKNGATGIGSSTPEALLDIDSNNKGILVPRVALTSANVAAPVTNPNGGALPESTLVYNTSTAGIGENEVTPGFHYWNGTNWVKLEENNGKTKYYTTLGTTNATSTSAKTLMPEMEITFTPKSNVVLVNFSASGYNAQGQTPVFFDVLLNGTIVKSFQTSVEDLVGGTNRPIWDINFLYPLSVTPFVTQTISINWATINTVSSNFVQTPASYAGSLTINAHRVLNVIDPEGGGGIVTPVVPPITNEYWNINGNTGTNPSTNFIGTSDAQPLVFRTNNVERMRIFNGNLGIGTTAPTAPLEVMGNIRMVDGNQQTGRVLTSSASGLASWQDLNTWSILGNAGTNPTTNFIGTSDNQSFVFRTNNLERMQLTPTGDLGIGTSTPSRNLELSSAGNVYSRITSTSNNFAGIELLRVGSSLSADWRIQDEFGSLVFSRSTSDLGSVTAAMRISGVSLSPGSNNTMTLGGTTTRWTEVFATNGVINTSDRREKQGISELTYGLEKIMQLQPKTYQWIDPNIDNHNTHLGFIAQELKEILPEVVVDKEWKSLDENGNKQWMPAERLGVNYAEIIPVLVKGIQEQQQIIENQNNEIESLKSQLQMVISRIETLEKK